MQILLSNSQAGPGRTVKQEQEEIYRNHVQASILADLCTLKKVITRMGIALSRHALNGAKENEFGERERERSASHLIVR